MTQSNSSTLPQGYSSGLISSLVCPYPLLQTGLSWEQFSGSTALLPVLVCNVIDLVLAVVTNGSWRYGFLPLTICEISPLVTTSLVNYSSGVISTSVISSRPLGSSNMNLTRFLAALVDHQAWYTQGLTTNDIGDALYAIYVSASENNSNSAGDVNNLLLRELVSLPVLCIV